MLLRVKQVLLVYCLLFPFQRMQIQRIASKIFIYSGFIVSRIELLLSATVQQAGAYKNDVFFCKRDNTRVKIM